MRTQELRDLFTGFFKEHGHTIVPSDSLIPSGDPTLLFTSAGMVQFKKHFLGQIQLDYRRAASIQKCLRTSDIERVGLTARHLTFFEMLGNFSFGDYFKTEAIAWGWEFLTKRVGLEAQKLYPTVYLEDDEAFELWKKFAPESRIVRMGADTNFWTMGPTGPCGPCSEILYDRGEKWSQGHACRGPNCDCDRYLEIWNLVFTQFDRSADGKLTPLPQKNIDTGMGLERLAMVSNSLDSAYDTDTFQNIIRSIKAKLGENVSIKSQRMISDHIRSTTFLIADGVLPSNEGRGYVLRRLLRRALRQGWIHGVKKPFLFELSASIAKEMGAAYPEIVERLANIQSIIETEEKNSLATIEMGTKTLEQSIEKATGKKFSVGLQGSVNLPGAKVFNIYDTYGLDPEIQKEIVKDAGAELVFSDEEYAAAKAEAVERARKGWKGSGEKDVTLYSEIAKQVGATKFCGYEKLSSPAKVLAILTEQNGKLVAAQNLSAGQKGEIVLSETPFYAESGGQVGDQGWITAKGVKVWVEDTQKPTENFIVHSVEVKEGSIAVGALVEAQVEESLRRHSMRHHTATHLLHAALRKVLGEQVTQAGSLVSAEKLRFDFTFPRSVNKAELKQVEGLVNQAILANAERKRGLQPLSEARKHGALAFFGDKYGAEVFVVGFGDYSTEVCGGTHCLRTGDIGFFKIIAESSVGSGVRRIEAVGGEKALNYVEQTQNTLSNLAEKLRASPEQAMAKIDKLLEREKELEREIERLKKQGQNHSMSDVAAQAVSLPGGKAKWLCAWVQASDAGELRTMADHLRDTLQSAVVVLAAVVGEKVAFVASVTKDLTPQWHAGKLVQALAKELGGSGGGKDLFAQGGAALTSKDEALAKLKAFEKATLQ